ncbi:Xbp1p Ecym_3312 [Eremothecium cymbalariae DBVPG|uniref:HTH APSES-type domain-containing protein n=1 Tax=Eremothecium cymbalariae (strain CBS 270.75 / DBVPG 7215 / KCTC 17166 / NRRL Y-17582) TaxID=931890 RepID=G8JRN4_ERECY|nr:Hypothetical protein Ecym_3312 [Eremothecium cymbalariae DBVPG\
MSKKANYRCTPMNRLESVALTDSPIDDYQRYYFMQIVSRLDSAAACELDLLERVNADLNIRTTSYRTNSAFQFYDLSMGQAKAEPCQLSRKERKTLECFEYQIPDITKGPCVSGDISLHRQHGFLCVNSENVIKLQQQRGPSAPDISFLTKNQQFKLQKLQYSEHATSVINPNNVILWDYKTGYVFFTGIWRLYQDVMRAMCNMPRTGSSEHEEENSQKRLWQCVKELEYSLKSCLYEANSHVPGDGAGSGSYASVPYKRHRVSSDRSASTAVPAAHGGGLGIPGQKATGNQAGSNNSSSQTAGVAGGAPSHAVTSGNGPSGAGAPCAASSLSYTDVHWNQLDPAWKQQLCQMFQEIRKLDFTLDFQDCYKRIRGGYIKIQGTWLPLEISRQLCTRFCFPIRYLLVPIFGADFPRQCEEWHIEHRVQQPQQQPATGFNNDNGAGINDFYTNQVQTATPLDQTSISPRSSYLAARHVNTLAGAKKNGSDLELLDASQNLLDISRTNFTNSDYYLSPNTPPPILSGSYYQRGCLTYSDRMSFDSSGILQYAPVATTVEATGPPASYKQRAHSWSGTTPQVCGNPQRRESLPPISNLINSLPNFNSGLATYQPQPQQQAQQQQTHQKQQSSRALQSYANGPSQVPSNQMHAGFLNPKSYKRVYNSNKQPEFCNSPLQALNSEDTAPQYAHHHATDGPMPIAVVPEWSNMYATDGPSYTYSEGVHIGYSNRL